jgi:hypothetical protein
MKIFVLPASYSFNATARTITFASQIPSAHGLILEVLNVTRGVIYYLPEGGAALSGTWTSPVLTLSASTTGHSSGDVLRVIVDDGLATQTINDGNGSITVDNANLSSIDGKLPSLVSNRLPVDIGSSIEISNDTGNPVPVSGNFYPTTQPISGSISIAGTAAVSGTFWPETQPVSGTFWQATQPISALALPLPGGAATEARQTTGNTSLVSIDGKLSGVASDATLAQVRDAIKAQLDLESTLWTDNSGSYYVRRDSVNQGTGVVTITFTDPTGTTATPGAGLRPLSAADRDITQALFDVITTGTGYTAGDLLARVAIIDANPSAPVVTAIWINLTTGAVISAPTSGHVERADETIGARQVGSWTVTGPLTDTQLRAQVVPTSPNITRGGGAVDANVTRVTLASDSPGVTALANIDADLGAPTDSPAATPTATAGIGALIRLGLQNAATALTNWTTLLERIPTLSGGRVPVNAAFATLTPTVTSVASSITSVTLLATNSSRRALWVTNDSTSVLRLSFSTPATQANSSVIFQPGQFLILDPLMIGTGAIYGIWASANGTAQVTEFT